jgi:hypothetical protein
MSETKTVTEYRAIRRIGGILYDTDTFDSRVAAEVHKQPNTVRIEQRQVSYGPWTAVEEATRGSEGEK